MIPLVLLGVLVILVAARSISQHRIEHEVHRRLPVGPDGIIPGAGPIALIDPPSPEAVLLLHGFGDSPQSLLYIARALHARGFAVYAPLLPGHGRTLGAFRASGAAAWFGAARDALREVEARHRRVGVLGLSMGGALAVELAAESKRVDALVLLAPYVEPPAIVRAFAHVATVVGSVVPYVARENVRSILDPDERARIIAYRAAPPRLIAEVVAVAARARRDLPRVSAPALCIQSRGDNRLTVGAAERTFAALGSPVKVLEWMNGAGHVITVDYGWQRVATRAGAWFAQYLRDDSREGRSTDVPQTVRHQVPESGLTQ